MRQLLPVLRVLLAALLCLSGSFAHAQTRVAITPELSRALLAQNVNLYRGSTVSLLPEFVLRDLNKSIPQQSLAGLVIVQALIRPDGVVRLQEHLRPARTIYEPDLGRDAAHTMKMFADALQKTPGALKALQASVDPLRKTLDEKFGKLDAPETKAWIDDFFDGSNPEASRPEFPSRPAAATAPTRAPAASGLEKSASARRQLYEAHAPTFGGFRGVSDRYSDRGSDDEPARELWRTLKGLGRKFTVLAADPGIALRAREFVDFARGLGKKSLSPWELRERFKEALGKVTVYRAVALKEGDEQTIFQSGMESSAAKLGDSKPFAARLVHQIDAHMTGTREHDDPWISVTYYPDLAATIAHRYASPSSSPDQILHGLKNIYVFRLSLWALDLIDAHRGRSADFQYRDLNGKVVDIPLDAKAESLVFHKIDPDEIESVTRIAAEDLLPQ